MVTDMPVVTSDPKLLIQLEARIDDMSSQALAEFARSLGLTPPEGFEVLNPPVVLHYPADSDMNGPGQIVWDMRSDTG